MESAFGFTAEQYVWSDLLCGIEKFAADVIHTRSSSPKFQVHNNALISLF